MHWYLPNEVLRQVLLSVTPNDLIALASTTRHFRRAVPACIDYDLAKQHVLAASGADVSTPPRQTRKHRLLVRLDHPLLFEHAVATVWLYGISESKMVKLWRKPWRPKEKADARSEAVRLHRVRVLQAAVKKRVAILPNTLYIPFILTLDENSIKDVLLMAAIIKSIDLFEDLRSAIPRVIHDRSNPESPLFMAFINACVENGFRDGLQLICNKQPMHPLFRSHRKALFQSAITSRNSEIVELLLDNRASPNSLLGDREPKPALFHALADEQVHVSPSPPESRSRHGRLLCAILLDVKPNDLIAIAAVNRHLRCTVPVCIDSALAKCHVTALSAIIAVAVSMSPYSKVSEALRHLHFDHPLLFEHAVAVLSRYGISRHVTKAIWGKRWYPNEPAVDAKSEAIRLHRVRFMRGALQNQVSQLRSASAKHWALTMDKQSIIYAAEMAGLIKSTDLLGDLLSAFPETLTGKSPCLSMGAVDLHAPVEWPWEFEEMSLWQGLWI
ncbi:hypothetical protein HDU96_008151 [Phlyctochytrium bullatum]|nr:hypothetical protein HDU96_008151 [Phlyctochytrium bullatum]